MIFIFGFVIKRIFYPIAVLVRKKKQTNKHTHTKTEGLSHCLYQIDNELTKIVLKIH